MNKPELFPQLGKLVAAIALVLWFVATSVSHSEDSWTRGIGGGTFGVADVKFEAFELNTVSKNGRTGHMSGSCAYYNRSPAVFALKGTETLDGEFHPSVVNQVGNSKNGEWRTIARPVVRGEVRTLTLRAKSSSKLLTVDLDAFVRMIGKFKYGRLVLKTGESAIFDLDYLVPPKGEKSRKGQVAK